jgi:hypothetical protein
MGLRTVTIVCLVNALLQAQGNAPGASAQPNPAAGTPEAPQLVNCPAGSPLGAVDLQVQAGDQKLPFRTINRLSENDKVLYAPVLRGKEKRTGEIALVLVPEKREPGQEDIFVTEPKPANKPESWDIPQTISVAAVVYGPAGLNRKKVVSFLSRDEVLVAQLADYADKTAQAEQLVATLSNSESSAASVNSALNGFASQYGFAVQVDRSAPPSAQAATVFGAMNPQLASYNPLASSTAQSLGQTASLATIAGTLFFGSPVGLAAGGMAMLLDLRSVAFPDTQFRASFAQPLTRSASGVNLCGQQGPLPPHTRVAYIWASRVPNIPVPTVKIGAADFIPATQKTPLPVDVPEPGWKFLDRARAWALVSKDKKVPVPVPVVKLGNQHALELDLTKANLPPGDYDLTGLWDWTPLRISGAVHVMPLSDFQTAHVDPASQDHLLAKSGKTPVTVTGSDFEFTEKVELKKLHDEFAVAESVRFLLPKGLRVGPQDQMDVQIDTEKLDSGSYALLISQQDGKSHPVEFKVLPNPPKIENLPILVNHGAGIQHFVLKGQRLEQVKKLEAPEAILSLSSPGTDQVERSLTVELKSAPKPGTTLPITEYIEDRSEPLKLPGGLQITGPLPVIASSKLSLPAQMAIAVRAEEFPAGYTLNAMLDVKNIERKSLLRLACADGVGTAATLHIGEQTANWALQQLSPDQLFLAFDTSGLPAGCSLEAVIDNGRGGISQPAALAHILRVPQVDSFTVADGSPQNGIRQYQLTGQNLEMIEKMGWDDSNGLDVSGLPTPLPGPGLKQSIQLNLPDPLSPDTMLYVWLRGDTKGRTTLVKAPDLPADASPTAASAAKASAKAATATSLKAEINPSTTGHAVTFTATVTIPGGGNASGTVTFMAGNTTLGTGSLDSSGTATFSTSALSKGIYSVVAVYWGSAGCQGSTSSAVTLVAH